MKKRVLAFFIFVAGATANLSCKSVSDVYNDDGCCTKPALSNTSLYRYENTLSKYVGSFYSDMNVSSSIYDGASISILSIRQLGPILQMNITMHYSWGYNAAHLAYMTPLPCAVDNYMGTFVVGLPIICFQLYLKDDRIVFHFDCSDSEKLCLIQYPDNSNPGVPHVEFLVQI